MKLPKSIEICEVSLRDGLQNEEKILSTNQKLKLLASIQNTGVRCIEIGSLVNPKAVPAMADTEQVYMQLPKLQGIEYRALVLNQKGIERAAAAGIRKVKITISASEAHQRNNANSSLEEMFAKFSSMAEFAATHGLTLSGAVSTSFFCPFEGEISANQIIRVIDEFQKIGVTEISLSDTTGSANPAQVFKLCSEMREAYPNIIWNLHFHNTRGMGLANVLAGMQAGITRFDACLGGLGGCPFAPGATGNIATEDLVHMCNEMGIASGIDLDELLSAARMLQEYVGHELSGAILKAGKVSDLCRQHPTR